MTEAQATRPLPDDVKAAVERLTLALSDEPGKPATLVWDDKEGPADDVRTILASLTAAQAEIAEKDAKAEAKRLIERARQQLAVEAENMAKVRERIFVVP